jgi:hypothetical protein
VPPPSLPRGHQVLVRFSLRWGLSMVRVAESQHLKLVRALVQPGAQPSVTPEI